MEIIHFNQNEFLEGRDLQERVGLRGRNMLEMAQVKTPIAPGFIIDSATMQDGLKEKLTLETLEPAVKKIEALTQKTFNAPERPMLFKVVMSPSIQIGSIRSVHTVGINDEVAQGFARYCGEDFAYGEYRHYMEQIGTRFLGKKMEEFKAVGEANAGASHKDVCAQYRQKVVPDFPQNGFEQLRLVLTSLAGQYLDDSMNEGIEAGLLVQMMVYGNFGEKSYNGQLYSRDIVSGAPELFGFFGHNEFDTTPDKAEKIEKIDSVYLEQLKAIAAQLEEKFLDIRFIKFVIEDDRIWLVEQTPVDAKSTQAEVRTLLDLNGKGLVSNEKMVNSVPPSQLQDLLHPIINHETTREMPKVVGGLAGCPGAAVGRVAFSTKTLLAEYKRCSLMGINSSMVLVMAHTDAEDVEAIELGVAVIASEGGYASHAPVVSRSLRKPCLLYDDIEYHDGYVVMGGQRINELDTVSLEVPTYTDPTVWIGEADMVSPDTSENGLEDFVGAVGRISGRLAVRGIATSVADIEMALRLGAEGIGHFSCDSLLKHPETLKAFREALVMSEPNLRAAALAEVVRLMKKDVLEVLEVIGEKPITFNLLNSPLSEFLPHSPEEQKTFYAELARKNNVSEEEVATRASQLRNINPMMGLRGSRIAIAYPDLYQAQLMAILGAAYEYSAGGENPLNLEVMVPAIFGDAEMRFIRYGRNIESTTIDGIHGVEKKLASQHGVEKTPFGFRVGAVIELPAAALMAGHISKQSDFFSIDINMLTQTTNGMSVDDINLFLPSYTQYDILKDNPFQILSLPVRELIATAVHFGKMTRPDLEIGLCGDHAADPTNVEFALDTDLNFVTCSPFGVPIAKLSVAQRMLKEQG